MHAPTQIPSRDARYLQLWQTTSFTHDLFLVVCRILPFYLRKTQKHHGQIAMGAGGVVGVAAAVVVAVGVLVVVVVVEVCGHVGQCSV